MLDSALRSPGLYTSLCTGEQKPTRLLARFKRILWPTRSKDPSRRKCPRTKTGEPNHCGKNTIQQQSPAAPDYVVSKDLSSIRSCNWHQPHRRHAFAEHWGEGKTSSSDGQRFRAVAPVKPLARLIFVTATNLACFSIRIFRTSTRRTTAG
jgi:hypothetical protein